MFHRLFVHHPRTVGENYSEHFIASWSFGFSMIAGGLACFVHGLIPGFFVTTGSNTVRRLYGAMVTNRMRQPVVEPGTAIGDAAE